MNIDFSTLYLISIPGFLIGIVTGRFLMGKRWQSIKKALGVLGQLLSAAGLVILLIVSVIVVGIMTVYLINLPESASSVNFWTTLLLALWILLNLLFEFRDARIRKNRFQS